LIYWAFRRLDIVEIYCHERKTLCPSAWGWGMCLLTRQSQCGIRSSDISALIVLQLTIFEQILSEISAKREYFKVSNLSCINDCAFMILFCRDAMSTSWPDH
jgi:hypothetical protein